jgi:trehalose/maltose hydrolase-like predicted phosphorylase
MPRGLARGAVFARVHAHAYQGFGQRGGGRLTLMPVPESVWQIALDGYDDEHQRVHNALFALAGCGLGTSGGPLLVRATADRWIVVAGVYDGDGPDTHLLTGPVFTGLTVADADERFRRVLDLRTGVLRERIEAPHPTEMVRFVSLARPGIVAARTWLPGAIDRGSAQLSAVADGKVDEGVAGDLAWMRVTGSEGGIVAALCETRRDRVVDDIAAVVGDASQPPEPELALAHVKDAAGAGFDVLLAEQERAWGERWDDADVVIEGDDHLQLATRFALFHLMASVRDSGEAPVGARGVTGTGYRGHVFWDADTFVLPFLAATHPASAACRPRSRRRASSGAPARGSRGNRRARVVT